MNKNKPIHMSNNEFKKYGYAVIDWIADYYENVENYSVKSNIKPGNLRSSLQTLPPETGESMNLILEDIDKLIMPEYLKTESSNNNKVIDYRDWQISLGRRFRSLKLWAVIRYYGVDGLQDYIRNHISLTQKLLDWINSDKNFEVIAPAPFNLICFRAKGSNNIQRLFFNMTFNADRF